MKKTIRRLRLQKETLRRLQPEQLDRAAGGRPRPENDFETFNNSCNPADASCPRTLCESKRQEFCAPPG